MVNYYEVLGIAPTSSPQEIKRSFRRRAKEIHPDVHPQGPGASADGEMRLLLEAYAVLSDFEKRDAYDRTLESLVRIRGFDYRAWLQGRSDPLSRAKLIFHDLLASHEDDAVELYLRLGGMEGIFELDRYMSREDYMDCAFLLAEVLESRGRWADAYTLYRKLYLWEQAQPYFRHFVEEVVDRLRTLVCFKMLPVLPPREALERLQDLLRLDFSRKDNAFFYKKIAEVYAAMDQQDLAVRSLQKGLQLDHKLSGVKKLMERIGCPVCSQNPS